MTNFLRDFLALMLWANGEHSFGVLFWVDVPNCVPMSDRAMEVLHVTFEYSELSELAGDLHQT